MQNDKNVDARPQIEDEDEYPPRKMVIPAMLAIALAIFLVALVIPDAQTRRKIEVTSPL